MHFIFLSNDKFKELFADRHPQLCKSVESLQKKFQFLCDAYPTKCWKIASCVFETGNLNFTASVLNDGYLMEIKTRDNQIKEYKSELKKICGDFPYDPASPIHLAWVEHAKTKDVLGDQPGRFTLPILQEKKDKFGEILFKEQPVEETFREIIAFDKRLLPYANHIRYEKMEADRSNLQWHLDIAEGSVSTVDQFTRRLEWFFQCELDVQLREMIVKQEPLTDEDCEVFLSALKIWANAQHWSDLTSAIETYLRTVALSYFSSQLPHDISIQTKANAKKIRGILNNYPFHREINKYAKKPIESHNIDSLKNEIKNILSLSFLKGPGFSELALLEPIYEHHGLDIQNPSSIPENIRILTDYVYKEAIRVFVAQPFSGVSTVRSRADFAQKLGDVCGISLDIVHQDLMTAIRNKEDNS